MRLAHRGLVIGALVLVAAVSSGCGHSRPSKEWIDAVHVVDSMPAAPEIVVMTQNDDGTRARLKPGRLGRPTIMCFAPLSFSVPSRMRDSLGTSDRKALRELIDKYALRSPGPAAIKYAHDLGASLGVDTISVIERFGGSEFLAAEFIDYWAVESPVYYDDGTAVRAMLDAADVDYPFLLAIFVLDRQRRIRFFRVEFPFGQTATMGEFGVLNVTLDELAPEGERITDYVRQLLDE